MSLTPAELAAARAFRETQRRALDGGRGGPPDITASVYVHHERHDCAARGGKSVFLELREHYVFSPAYLVSKELPEDARRDVDEENGQWLIGDRIVGEFTTGDPEWSQEMIDLQEETGLRHLSVIEAVVPARRFGWIFTEGRCPACGMIARSGHGRLVDPAIRPPAEHAIVT